MEEPDPGEQRFQQAMQLTFGQPNQSENVISTSAALSRRVHGQLLENAIIEPGKLLQFCEGNKTLNDKKAKQAAVELDDQQSFPYKFLTSLDCRDICPNQLQQVVDVHQKSGNTLISLGSKAYVIKYQSCCRKIERLFDVQVPNYNKVTCLKFLDKWVPPKKPTEPDSDYFIAAVDDKSQTIYTFKQNQIVRTLKVFPPQLPAPTMLNLGGVAQDQSDRVIAMHDFVHHHSQCSITQAYFILVVTELGLCKIFCLSIQEANVHQSELFEHGVVDKPLGFTKENHRLGLQMKLLNLTQDKIVWSRVQQACVDKDTRHLAISVLTKTEDSLHHSVHVYAINRLNDDRFSVDLKDSVVFRDCPTHFAKNFLATAKLVEIAETRCQHHGLICWSETEPPVLAVASSTRDVQDSKHAKHRIDLFHLGSKLNLLDSLNVDSRVTALNLRHTSPNCDFFVGFERIRTAGGRTKVESALRIVRLETSGHFDTKATVHSTCEQPCSRQSVIALREAIVESTPRLLMLTADQLLNILEQDPKKETKQLEPCYR